MQFVPRAARPWTRHQCSCSKGCRRIARSAAPADMKLGAVEVARCDNENADGVHTDDDEHDDDDDKMNLKKCTNKKEDDEEMFLICYLGWASNGEEQFKQ